MGRLDVRICEARHITNDIRPYVVFVVENQHNSTHVAPHLVGSTSVKWESAFKFTVHDEQGVHVRFELWSRAAAGDELMGVLLLPVSSLTKGVVKDTWFVLQRCKSAIEMRVRVCALDFGGFVASPEERRGQVSAYSPQLEVPPPSNQPPHQVPGPTPTVGYMSAPLYR